MELKKMNQRYVGSRAEPQVEVVDRDGWRKAFPLEKHIVHIGSDPRNDVVLDSRRGAGVAARHLQLIALPANLPGYRLVNLGDGDILLGESGERVLAPRSATDIADGAVLRVGDFTLLVCCGEAAAAGKAAAAGEAAATVVGDARPPGPLGAEASSQVIGLRLVLPQTHLKPGEPIDGAVVVRNLGDQPGVQFKLAVEGLHPDCYGIGAGPLLFPNAEKETFFRLSHPRSPCMSAGDHRFTVRATAPGAYPGESAVISQTIQMAPFYHHSLRLVIEDS
jgi:hypothetical protein